MALITGTIKLATDDLMHFSLLLVIVYMTCAVMAHLLFGAQYSEFNSIHSTLITQLNIFIGEIEGDSFDDPKMAAYMALCLIVFFFLLMCVCIHFYKLLCTWLCTWQYT